MNINELRNGNFVAINYGYGHVNFCKTKKLILKREEQP